VDLRRARGKRPALDSNAEGPRDQKYNQGAVMKRILVGLGWPAAADPLYRCLLDVVNRSGGVVTGIPIVDPEQWKNTLPDLMTAGFGARLLEERPWNSGQELLRNIEQQFLSACRTESAAAEFRRAEGDPIQFLAELSSYYDLLIVGLPPLVDPQVDAELERGLRAGRSSGIPVLRPSAGFSTVTRILIVLSDTPASFRALRSFASLALWPEAIVYVTQVGSPVENAVLEETATYCRLHGRTTVIPEVEFNRTQDALHWVAENKIDLLVSGWSWFRLLDARIILPNAGGSASLLTTP
jgi:hypothetical protein